MTLFTANGLLWRETRGAMRGIAMMPVDAIYESYLDWYDTQNSSNLHENKICWIKNIPELNVSRAPGNTCLSALASGKKGTIEQPINDSKGCGGIMRVAPIGLYMKNADYAGKFSAEASAITHGHPLGIIPAYVFGTMLYYIVNENMNIEDSLSKSIEQYKAKFNIYDLSVNQYFIDIVNKAVNLSKENKNDIDCINELGEGWVAEEAFAIAIYSCLKYSDSFENAVICSINHDGDSDSTGSIAGNIMGAYLGYDKIPEYYINNLELKDVILELAEDLSSKIPVGEYNETNDEYWLSKYLYCDKSSKGDCVMNNDKSVEEFMNKIIDEEINKDSEFEKYCELYKEKFGKRAYIAQPNGTKKQTIEAIKICLEKNEDLLDKLLYPTFDEDMKNGVLY